MKIEGWARWLDGLLIVVMVAYPFAVYFGLKNFSPRAVAFSLAVLLALRGLAMAKSEPLGRALWVAVAVGVVLNLLAALFENAQLVQIYPVTMSLAACAVFTISLFNKPTLIERIARWREGELSEAAVRYTFKVTLIWSVFLFLNACASAATVLWSDLETWALYNGFISYILMGTLFVGELIYRRTFVLKARGKP